MTSKEDKIQKISAFIVCFNEDKVIERCLKSVANIVDEIIVIHDGPCSDKTLEISKKYTSKVFEMKTNRGIGEAHYIFALSKSKYNWILRIDADEYLSDELSLDLKELTRAAEISAYNFIWPIWDGKKYISKDWPYKIFLFQKDKVGIVDLFHHPIIVHGNSKNVPLVMHHQPKYNNYTYQNFQKKILKWCKYQARDYLIPLEKRKFYNVDLEVIRNEINRKIFFYNFPIFCFGISFTTVIFDLFKKPFLFFQKGFWLTALIAGRYSYFVAKEYTYLKRNVK